MSDLPHVRLVSRLLWLANSGPPIARTEQFYALKDRILRRWGTRDGHDWQHIIKECYGCDGRGESRECPERACRRCGGSGVYDHFFVKLERWDLAGRTFHRPAEKTWKRPSEPVAIVGRVRHADVGRAGNEAALWLALLLDRRLFAALMTSSCCCGPTWRYPLVTLQKLTFRLGMAARGWERRRCVTCGRGFRQGFRSRGCHSFVCGRCDRPGRRRAEVEVDDIPF
jgi:hypothetical protein